MRDALAGWKRGFLGVFFDTVFWRVEIGLKPAGLQAKTRFVVKQPAAYFLRLPSSQQDLRLLQVLRRRAVLGIEL
jgi:hypothetical protein